MAGRRSIGRVSSDPSVVTQAIAVAEQLSVECSTLLELYKQKESFTSEVADSRLVSAPHPSAQLDSGDKLWSLHMALLQCRGLMKRAMEREEKELGSEKNGSYEGQRRVVKERLSLLVGRTAEILKAVKGAAAVPPSLAEPEWDGSSTFELKVWVFRVFKEVDYWTKAAITTLKSLSKSKEPVGASRNRSDRNGYR
ncbi:ciliary neurotrophic factor [Synchiropus picturatus]